jgi:hypothetical protein
VTLSDPTGMLGSASCTPGYVGGPRACSGTENPPTPALPSGGPPVGYGPCNGSHSASNCDNQDSPVNGGYKGPCDGHHSASNCAGPQPSPWDVIGTTWYPNGTTLYVYRNGQARINDFLLPDGVIDADQLAAALDQGTSPDFGPDTVATTISKISQIYCHPAVCTVEFHENMVNLSHLIWRRTAQKDLPGVGLCLNATALYKGVQWGGDACVYYDWKATYISVGATRGRGVAVGLGANGTMLFTKDMKGEVCNSTYYASASVPDGGASYVWDHHGHPVSAAIGGGVGVGASAGASDTFKMWQFGDGHFGDQICPPNPDGSF